MSTHPVTPHPNLIVGCGYLGRRVATRWLAAGRCVTALTRRHAEMLATMGIEPVLGDVLDPTSLKSLPPASTVLYAIAWDRSSGEEMHDVLVTGLSQVLDSLPTCKQFIYISSSSVYGQTDGSLVDETTPTEPVEESGKVILEAEHLLRAKQPKAIILRFAGIYGPDRLLRKQPLLAGDPLVGDADRWLNLIHVDDGADAVLWAESRGEAGETYNIADNEPVSRRRFYTLLAELLKASIAKFDERPEPGAANRRVSNRKAREELNWMPRFPSYREGLPSAVQNSIH